MDNNKRTFSPTRELANKVVLEAFKILKEAGGQLRGREVIKKIEDNLDLNDWEKAKYEKTGAIRWRVVLRFFLINCSKAGFLRRTKGVWYLTEDGESAIDLGAVGLLDKANEEYKKWSKKNKPPEIEDESELQPNDEHYQEITLVELEEQALTGLRDFIISKNPYEFQDLVAALLRAMGYYTPFISPKGRDGGLDIVAYQDPLGTKTPRIKVQVKHKPDASISVNEIRSLTGLLNKDGDVGLFVTSGSFTNESERFARDSHIHIKLIDFEGFISLWQQFYSKLNDEEKNLLPLQPIYFLGSNE